VTARPPRSNSPSRRTSGSGSSTRAVAASRATPVTWTVKTGGGSLIPPGGGTTTDVDGYAHIRATLGLCGRNRRAVLRGRGLGLGRTPHGSPVRLCANANPGAASSIGSAGFHPAAATPDRHGGDGGCPRPSAATPRRVPQRCLGRRWSRGPRPGPHRRERRRRQPRLVHDRLHRPGHDDRPRSAPSRRLLVWRRPSRPQRQPVVFTATATGGAADRSVRVGDGQSAGARRSASKPAGGARDRRSSRTPCRGQPCVSARRRVAAASAPSSATTGSDRQGPGECPRPATRRGHRHRRPTRPRWTAFGQSVTFHATTLAGRPRRSSTSPATACPARSLPRSAPTSSSAPGMQRERGSRRLRAWTATVGNGSVNPTVWPPVPTARLP